MRGKFLGHHGGEKSYFRGATYGTFRRREDGSEYPEPEVVAADFAAMAAAGIDTVRTYTVPPGWLLDAAAENGLRLMVGLAAERYVGYLNDRHGGPDIERLVRDGVRQCTGHPAVAAYAVGNEIPAGVVRWHGRRRIERYLFEWWHATKDEDPEALVTYANYPSTEYLQLQFLDFVCFNVFLESPARLSAYVKRLHNIAGDRPLVIGELGLDSNGHGEEAQALCVEALVRTAFTSGCAGVFVYAWTDEWHTAGGEVLGWSFGLTRRDRSPKPALERVSGVFADLPIPQSTPRPHVSVIVCTYQGGRRIARCLEGISRLAYPDFETILVDDGSTDDTLAVARRYPDVRVVASDHRGLGHARNVGLQAARGEIVAYIDDDAYPDPHWLDYLVQTFATTDHVAVGGPNIAPPDSAFLAHLVGRAPGNPIHVLLSDDEAEHIPGCNMAFRRSRLEEIGGFDLRFLAAGDDVDVCWRIRARGWTIGFSPSALVWHDPRPTIRTYLRQQVGYGRAEGVLEKKWPEKYNVAGQASWGGRLYGTAVKPLYRRLGRIYHGVWGQAPFQSVYEPASGWGMLPLTPEWYLMVAVLAGLAAMGRLWRPLLLALVPLTAALAASVVQAVAAALRVTLELPPRARRQRLRARAVLALLHLLQPLARLRGHLSGGLTPWRRDVTEARALPLPYQESFWSERWHPPEEWVRLVEQSLTDGGATVLRGGDFDRFDLEIRGGTSGAVRLLMAVEEHGAGRQLVRVRAWPRWSRAGRWIALLALVLAAGAALDTAWAVAVAAACVAVWSVARGLVECAGATAAARHAVRQSVAAAAEELRRLPRRATVR